MCAGSEKVALVVPCYNEALRLNLREFKKVDKDRFYFLFVNDGSEDKTLYILKENIQENFYILNLEKNVGKAEAIRRGMLYLKGLTFFKDIDWVGYWDADLSTPLGEIENFFIYARNLYGNVQAIWASRIFRLGSKVQRSFLRHFLGRMFATWAAIFLKIKSYDSQCGAKLFRKELIDVCFSEKFISSWIFDIEILLRLKETKVIEYPLKEWRERPGGNFKVFKAGIKAVGEVIMIRKRYFRDRST